MKKNGAIDLVFDFQASPAIKHFENYILELPVQLQTLTGGGGGAGGAKSSSSTSEDKFSPKFGLSSKLAE